MDMVPKVTMFFRLTDITVSLIPMMLRYQILVIFYVDKIQHFVKNGEGAVWGGRKK